MTAAGASAHTCTHAPHGAGGGKRQKGGREGTRHINDSTWEGGTHAHMRHVPRGGNARARVNEICSKQKERGVRVVRSSAAAGVRNDREYFLQLAAAGGAVGNKNQAVKQTRAAGVPVRNRARATGVWECRRPVARKGGEGQDTYHSCYEIEGKTPAGA